MNVKEFYEFLDRLNADQLRRESTRAPRLYTIMEKVEKPVPDGFGGEPTIFGDEGPLTVREVLETLSARFPRQLFEAIYGEDPSCGIKYECPGPHGEYGCEHDEPTIMEILENDELRAEELSNCFVIDKRDFLDWAAEILDLDVVEMQRGWAERPGAVFLTRDETDRYIERCLTSKSEAYSYAHFCGATSPELDALIRFLVNIDTDRSFIVMKNSRLRRIGENEWTIA